MPNFHLAVKKKRHFFVLLYRVLRLEAENLLTLSKDVGTYLESTEPQYRQWDALLTLKLSILLYWILRATKRLTNLLNGTRAQRSKRIHLHVCSAHLWHTRAKRNSRLVWSSTYVKGAMVDSGKIQSYVDPVPSSTSHSWLTLQTDISYSPVLFIRRFLFFLCQENSIWLFSIFTCSLGYLYVCGCRKWTGYTLECGR